MIEAGAMKSLHRGCRFKRSTSEQIEHQMVSAEWITNSNFSEADFWELGRFHLSDKRVIRPYGQLRLGHQPRAACCATAACCGQAWLRTQTRTMPFLYGCPCDAPTACASKAFMNSTEAEIRTKLDMLGRNVTVPKNNGLSRKPPVRAEGVGKMAP